MSDVKVAGLNHTYTNYKGQTIGKISSDENLSRKSPEIEWIPTGAEEEPRGNPNKVTTLGEGNNPHTNFVPSNNIAHIIAEATKPLPEVTPNPSNLIIPDDIQAANEDRLRSETRPALNTAKPVEVDLTNLLKNPAINKSASGAVAAVVEATTTKSTTTEAKTDTPQKPLSKMTPEELQAVVGKVNRSLGPNASAGNGFNLGVLKTVQNFTERK